MGKSRGIFNFQLRVNLDHGTHTELALLAQRQGSTIGAVARSIIEASIQPQSNRTEMTVAPTNGIGDSQVAASLAALGAKIEEAIQHSIHGNTALDELSLSYFLHTPEIPAAKQGSAFESGARRHKEFQGRVAARQPKRGIK